MTSTEDVFAALFAKLSVIPGLATSSRRLANVQDLNPEQFPAAYQVEGKQTFKFTPNAPAILTLRATWVFYAFESDQTQAPSTALNLLLDSARVAMLPPAGSVVQTLSGLVEFAAIQGEVEIFEGVLGDRAVALVPIAIVMPGF